MNKIQNIIKRLKLEPHPEGGYFKETYRSAGEINQLNANYQGKRNYSTCIYYLLTSDAFSAFHRIKQDEIWHFYDGSPVNLHQISPDGSYSSIIIGRDIDKGQQPQFVVKGGIWFAATVVNENDFSLVGCTVSPGFDFRDFEIADRSKLVINHPKHIKIITELTRA
jgi:hypothetical protein